MINCVILSHDDKYIASGSWDKTVKCWNRLTKECVFLENHLNSVETVAISIDGLYIASGSSDKTMKLWNR